MDQAPPDWVAPEPDIELPFDAQKIGVQVEGNTATYTVVEADGSVTVHRRELKPLP